MSDNIVDIDKRRDRVPNPPPVSDFWFAQLDVRLGRIEYVITRLEIQILIIACGSFGLLVLEIVRAIRGA